MRGALSGGAAAADPARLLALAALAAAAAYRGLCFIALIGIGKTVAGGGEVSTPPSPASRAAASVESG